MANKRSQKYYLKNEKETVKKIGLKATKGSGSGWLEKEDGYNENVIAQLKSTDNTSISFKLVDFYKLEANALLDKKLPLFLLQFLESDDLFLVIRPEDLKNIVKYLPDLSVLEENYSGELNLSEEISFNVDKPRISSGNNKKYLREKEKRYKKKRGR